MSKLEDAVNALPPRFDRTDASCPEYVKRDDVLAIIRKHKAQRTQPIPTEQVQLGTKLNISAQASEGVVDQIIYELDMFCRDRGIYDYGLPTGDWMNEMREIVKAAMPAQPRDGLLDPDMPDQQLRLHMGELTTQGVHDVRAAIRWANSRMPQGDGWRDISSAPTNTSILIYIPRYDHYGPGVLRAILCDMGSGRRWHTTGMHVGRDIGIEDHFPTHWMPLPPAPTTAGSKEEA